MSDELVLHGNTFGIPEVETGDEVIQRKLALIPMALQVLTEAAQTISRLSDDPDTRSACELWNAGEESPKLRAMRELIERAEMKSLGMLP